MEPLKNPFSFNHLAATRWPKKHVLLMASPLWKPLAPLSMVLLTSTLVPFAVLRTHGGLLCSIAHFKATPRQPNTFSSKPWPLAALSCPAHPSNSAPFLVWSPPPCGPSTCCAAPRFLEIHPYDGSPALGPKNLNWQRRFAVVQALEGSPLQPCKLHHPPCFLSPFIICT
ncbi:hypothetical protein GOP47_0023191 [Adiantum capillus-veneris]|uniref:Uncharacterized protein n=1 Tax=Adiantum capillus-veneris TaxID=13818 RepID=A0A9D4U7X1_ADICA|nr:hypothetical protein GOP47_0023191 [Adiantum capillus-veneris]